MSVRPFLSGAKVFWSAKDAFVQAYKSNPRLANALTGCATFSLGDILAQKIEQRRTGSARKLDLWRSVQLGLLGAVMNGFFLHHWYLSLDTVVGSSMTSKIGVAAKVLADQLIFAPFAIITFFSFNSARQSSSVTEAQGRLASSMQHRFVPSFLADCSLWPAANFVNFRFVQLPYRPSFTAAVQLLWQTYMSATCNRQLQQEQQQQGQQQQGQCLDPSSTASTSHTSTNRNDLSHQQIASLSGVVMANEPKDVQYSDRQERI